MFSQRSISFLLRLAVILAAPTLACFAYYTLERVGTQHRWLTMMVALALPLALIGLISTVLVTRSRQRTRLRIAASLICLFAPLLLLAAMWAC